MLDWKHISHDYGAGPVLEDLNLCVEGGEVVALAGRSGCGKTSLLQMAAGLLRPTTGTVVNDFARTACVFQEPRLLPWRRALDNIAFGLKALGKGRAERQGTARDLAARLGLDSADLGKFPHQLSGGMRQRVALARALAVTPDLLLLDEPFSALDVGLRRELQDLLLSLIAERGLAAVFVTHDLAEAVRLSHRIVILAPRPGRVVQETSVTRDFADRDADFVHAAATELLHMPKVRAAFANGAEMKEQHKNDGMRRSPKEEQTMELRSVNVPETRLATDMAGRKVQLRTQISKVFGYNPMVTALLYALAPEKIAGLNMPPMPPERMLAGREYLSLPVLGILGGNFGGGKSTFDKDAVRTHKVELLLSLTLSSVDAVEVRTAEDLQEELGIPVMIYDGCLDRTGEVLRRVGSLIGVPDRGNQLGAYFEEKFYAIQDTLAKIPRTERRTVYYAQSPTGLLTEPRKSRHGEIIDFSGGVNVADVYEQRGCGKTPVSADDLLRWNPDVIIMLSDEGKSEQRLYNRMRVDPFWSALKAVCNNSVYEPPAGMYHWFDRPPGLNRLMGMIWLTRLLYPEWFAWDLVRETREFYELFYRVRLGVRQAEILLGRIEPGLAN